MISKIRFLQGICLDRIEKRSSLLIKQIKLKMNNKILRALTLTTFNYVAVAAIRFIALLINVRLISKLEFGIASVIILILVFYTSVIKNGLLTAIIRDRELEQKRFVLLDNLSIYLSLIVAIALFSFSNQVSDLLGTNDFSAELKVASVCIIFIGLSTIPHSALLKNLNFSEIAKIHLFATTFGYFFVGSGLAYLGFQGLGLVIGIAAQEFILMLMCRRAYPRNNLHSLYLF